MEWITDVVLASMKTIWISLYWYISIRALGSPGALSISTKILKGIFFSWAVGLSSRLQFSSIAQSCLTLCDPWTAARQGSLSITNSQSLLKLMSIESVMPSNHFILCHPLLVPSVFPSIKVFSKESVLIRWPKYWSFRFSISPSSEYWGLISFRIDW